MSDRNISNPNVPEGGREVNDSNVSTSKAKQIASMDEKESICSRDFKYTFVQPPDSFKPQAEIRSSPDSKDFERGSESCYKKDYGQSLKPGTPARMYQHPKSSDEMNAIFHPYTAAPDWCTSSQNKLPSTNNFQSNIHQPEANYTPVTITKASQSSEDMDAIFHPSSNLPSWCKTRIQDTELGTGIPLTTSYKKDFEPSSNKGPAKIMRPPNSSDEMNAVFHHFDSGTYSTTQNDSYGKPLGSSRR